MNEAQPPRQPPQGGAGRRPPPGAERPRPQPQARPSPATPPPQAGGGEAETARRKRAATRIHESRDGRATPIVPPQTIAGRALLLVVAIMSLLACLTFGAVSLVRDAARDWQLDVSREVTIQVRPLEGVPIDPELQKALKAARETAGVTDVRLVPDRDGRKLLEPWLGADLDLSSLPVPRLIVVSLGDPASAELGGLKTRLAREVKGATLDDHSVWASRLRTMAGTMVAIGFAVLLLVLIAMVLSVVFATRAAMAGNRDVIAVLHFVGAEDAFIAREFQGHFLVLGLKGGLVGGVAAMATFLIGGLMTREAQGAPGADQMIALFGGLNVGPTGYLGAVAIVFLIAVLTALTSRLTVRNYLRVLD